MAADLTKKIIDLIDRSDNTNDKGNMGPGGNTLLHFAVINGHYPIAAKLIDKGAEINFKNEFGFTPLHEAASHNVLAVVERMLQRNPDLNSRTNAGNTPLQQAIIRGHC